MANSPDINKTQLVVRLERGLKRQLEKCAKSQKITSTKLVTRILHDELDHIELTPEDYRLIALEIEQEQKKRNNLQNRQKAGKTASKGGKSGGDDTE